MSLRVLICVNFLTCLIFAGKQEEEYFRLRILHTSNIKGRMEEYYDSIEKQYFGGFARLHSFINKTRSEKNVPHHVLYLDSGDVIVGTVWTSVYRHKFGSTFLNVIRPDVVCLGNHEFDFGITNLLNYVGNLTFPAVLSNLKYNNDTYFEKVVKRSVVLNLNGTKIGFVGFITTRLHDMIYLRSMEVMDEVTAITEVSNKLITEGVNIIIAIGHSLFRICKRVARAVRNVDVVVCGHRQIFLYNGVGPSREIPVDAYPRRVFQRNGKMVPVVHGFGYTKYLGDLRLTFNKTGHVVHSEGDPILLTADIPQDNTVMEMLDTFRPNITMLRTNILGKCYVHLMAACLNKECTLGNFITDSFVRYRLVRYRGQNWTDAAVAIMNAGAMRNHFYGSLENANITEADIMAALPYRNPLYIVEISGKNLYNILEKSVKNFNTGAFLTTAGLKIQLEIDPSLSPIIKSVAIRCTDCAIPHYGPLKEHGVYKFITTKFLVEGGDGYKIIPKSAISITPLNVIERNVIYEYLKVVQVIMPSIEGRLNVTEMSSFAIMLKPITNIFCRILLVLYFIY